MSELLEKHGTAAFIGAAVVLVLIAEGWLVFHVFRQHGRMLIRLDTLESALKEIGLVAADGDQKHEGLPIGSPAPSFELPSLSGEIATLERLHETGKAGVLIFSDPGCKPCQALLPDISRWQREHASKLTVAVVSRGAVGANRAKAAEYGVQNVLLQKDREIAEQYQALATPSAVLILRDGTIGSDVVTGADAIAKLIGYVASQPSADNLAPATIKIGNRTTQNLVSLTEDASQIGQPVPPFHLRDLSGMAVDSDALKGRSVLLLFWNPRCGYCNRMLPDLKNWQRDRPDGSPEIVMISTGGVEANRSMQLKSTVLLDDSFSVGTSLGARGTPSGILVDSNGKIASAVAVGASSVLALAASRVQERETSYVEEA